MGLSATDKLIYERVEDTIERFVKAIDNLAAPRLGAHAKGLALTIIELLPDGYGRTMAVAKVEEAVMWTINSVERASD
jgi:hypothetical protein